MSQKKWIDHYLKMVKGQLPHQKYYIISDDTQKGEGYDNIQVVAPTQLAVAQAEMAVKRKIDAISLREKDITKKKKLLKVKKAVKKSSTTTTKKDKVVKTKTKVKKNLAKVNLQEGEKEKKKKLQ